MPEKQRTGPVNLTVHRNTVERRRKKDLAKSMSAAATEMARVRDVRAWAIVGVGSDGQAYAAWDTGSIMPMWAFAETMSNVLRTDISNSDIEEDWRPVLSKKCPKP